VVSKGYLVVVGPCIVSQSGPLTVMVSDMGRGSQAPKPPVALVVVESSAAAQARCSDVWLLGVLN